jgi:voltage-gated potassium channel
MKQIIFKIVERGPNKFWVNILFDYLIISLIILNVIAIAIETVGNLDPQFNAILRIFEIFSVSVFTIEYSMRVYISDMTHPSTSKFKSILKFVLSGYGLIDLIAILPFYVPFIIKIDLRFIRVLRLIRFFRILKISRYNSTLKLIGSVIKDKKTELGMTLFVTILILIIASFLMYHIEGPIQPDKFPNVFATLWWAIATLTTIGYGDVYPITGLGKLLSGSIAILGIGMVALPTGIISAGFISKLSDSKSEKKKIKCPHCGNDIEMNH